MKANRRPFIRQSWLLITLTVCAPAQVVAPLAAAKEATGGAAWDRVKTLHLRGNFQVGSLNGSFEQWVDLPHSFSWANITFINPSLGTVRQTTGWNGKISWTADQTGDVFVARSEQALRDARSDAYVDSFAYLFSGRRAGQITPGDRSVRLSPPAADPLELQLDPVTHRVSSVAQLKGIYKSVKRFDNFTPVENLLLPFRITDGVSTQTITSVQVNATLPKDIFEPPAPSLTGLRFPEGKDSVTLDFRYEDDQIFLPLSINGKAQRNFMFDTGSTATIDTAKAASLGLKIEPAGLTYGGGPDAVQAGLTKIDRIEIGGLTMENQIIDTAVLTSSSGSLADGFIGYELARRAVVSIDYAAHRMTFTKPEAFRKPAHATALPLRFAEKSIVLIQATIDGIRGDFQIDTGQDAELTVNGPFAQKNGLLARYGSGRKTDQLGIGGVSQSAVFTPSSFTFGNLRPAVSEARIFLATSGSGVQEHVAGAIGNELLSHFVLTLDYAARTAYFEKSAGVKPTRLLTLSPIRPAPGNESILGWSGILKMTFAYEGPPIEPNAGGLERKSTRLEISEVAADGPAALAGLLPGDVVFSMNGSALTELSIEQAGRAFSAPAGTAVKLVVTRGSQKTDLSFNTVP